MSKKATVYRMVMDKHICPYGLKTLDLLKDEGYEVEDHHLSSREDTDQFKEKYDVQTTPQTFIDDKRIGGYDDLKKFFGKVQEGTTYRPIIAIFATTILMALSTAWALGELSIVRVIELFIAFSMCALAIQKLRDLEAFSLQFLNYDILAQKWVKYSYVYPFVEMLAGVAMISGFLTVLSAPAAIFIAAINGYSVFKAVYIDKRELKCACVGGNSNVPLGFISLTENIMMAGMGLWMLINF
jgi:glutaredoxin